MTASELRTEAQNLIEAYIAQALRIGEVIASDNFLADEFGVDDFEPCGSDQDCARVARDAASDVLDELLPAENEVSPGVAGELRSVGRYDLFPGVDPIEIETLLRSPKVGEIEVQVSFGGIVGVRGLFNARTARVRGDVRAFLDMLNMSDSLDDLGEADMLTRLLGTTELRIALQGDRSASVEMDIGSDVDLVLGYVNGAANARLGGDIRVRAAIDGDARTATGRIEFPAITGAVPTVVIHRAVYPSCAESNFSCEGGSPTNLSVSVAPFSFEGALATGRSRFTARFTGPASGPWATVRQGNRTIFESEIGGVEAAATVQQTAVVVEVMRAIVSQMSVDLTDIVDPEDLSSVYRSGIMFQGRYEGSNLAFRVFRDARTTNGKTTFARIDGGMVTLRSSDGLEMVAQPTQCLASGQPSNPAQEDHIIAWLSPDTCP